MSTTAIYTKREEILRSWGKTNLDLLKGEARKLGIRRYSGDFYRYLRDRYWKYQGRITALGYKMPRHAVFVHKGVGRGYPIEAVESGTISKSKSKTAAQLRNKGYNKTAIAMALRRQDKREALNGKPRKPKPWFNPIIDKNLDQLANQLAEADADIMVDNIFID